MNTLKDWKHEEQSAWMLDLAQGWNLFINCCLAWKATTFMEESRM